ncbi:DUF2490 domain-containing protein [Muricauda sp. NFXS6]|uniref:DUF2490 domain-containing protein n=1 Tax=Allomuricauda sp. NFXS6 TaxID=2819094 RepID=UPI0032DF1970
MSKSLVSALFGIICYSTCLAQISPPGLGDINTAGWFAIGLKQELSEKEGVTSTTYLGLGSSSNPNNFNPFERNVIYVVNQEIKHRFSTQWQYSGALSYRWQNNYIDERPYVLNDPNARQEFRVYGRFSYLNNAFSLTYRPELRYFFDPDFSPAKETVQFRSRIRTKIAINLNSSKSQKLTTTMEAFFSVGRTNNWGVLNYKEARFCIYYSISPINRTTFNIGYMNNILGKSFSKTAHYFGLDIIVHNLF